MEKGIKAVAKLSGVSIATVSRVLNGSANVSEKLKINVLKAADELNYKPNTAAREIHRCKSGLVMLLIPNITNPFFSEIIFFIPE